MTNKDILRIAMKQSAEDTGCKADDFKYNENIAIPFRLGTNARKYYKEPIACNLVSYGNNIVAMVKPECSKKRFSSGMGRDDSEAKEGCG